MTEDPESESEVPEVSDPRHHLVASGDTVDFEYEVGSFVSADPSCTTAIILVAEVDSRLLVALPESAWHRKRAKRAIAANSITKAVQVAIVPARAVDREQPQGSATLKIWLGLLSPEFEGQLVFPPKALWMWLSQRMSMESLSYLLRQDWWQWQKITLPFSAQSQVSPNLPDLVLLV